MSLALPVGLCLWEHRAPRGAWSDGTLVARQNVHLLPVGGAGPAGSRCSLCVQVRFLTAPGTSSHSCSPKSPTIDLFTNVCSSKWGSRCTAQVPPEQGAPVPLPSAPEAPVAVHRGCCQRPGSPHELVDAGGGRRHEEEREILSHLLMGRTLPPGPACAQLLPHQAPHGSGSCCAHPTSQLSVM